MPGYHKKNQYVYDLDSSLASAGKTDAGLLARLLRDECFHLAPPKSTGLEYFNLKWLSRHIDSELPEADVQSTLCDLTAISIIRAINDYAPDADEIYICGGGVRNNELMRRLQALSKKPVISTEKLGIHPDWLQAMTLACLAYQNVHQKTGNLTSVTGAKKAVVFGKKTLAA